MSQTNKRCITKESRRHLGTHQVCSDVSSPFYVCSSVVPWLVTRWCSVSAVNRNSLVSILFSLFRICGQMCVTAPSSQRWRSSACWRRSSRCTSWEPTACMAMSTTTGCTLLSSLQTHTSTWLPSRSGKPSTTFVSPDVPLWSLCSNVESHWRLFDSTSAALDLSLWSTLNIFRLHFYGIRLSWLVIYKVKSAMALTCHY